MYIPLLYGKVKLSVLIGSFLVGILPYGPFPRKRSKPCIFWFSKAGKFICSLNYLKETCKIPYMYLFEQKKTTMNQVIVRQMKEFSDNLPASELEHLWVVNTFVCMHLSSISLTKKRTRQQKFPFFFTSSLYMQRRSFHSTY